MTNRDVVQLIQDMSNQQMDALKKLLPTLLGKKKYYTYREAADMLCISVEGLKTRIKRGQMLRICNNNRPLIAHSEIMRFLDSQNPDGLGDFLMLLLALKTRSLAFHQLWKLQGLRIVKTIYNHYVCSSASLRLWIGHLQVIM